MKTKTTLPAFTLRLPRLTTRTVWVGFYSDMSGTVATLWSKKPAWDNTLECYNLVDNRVASLWVDEFIAWFGSVQPLVDAGLLEYRGERIGYVVTGDSLDCTKVTRIRLTAVWDKYGDLCGLNVNADN